MGAISHLSIGRTLLVLGALVLASVSVPLCLQLSQSLESIDTAVAEYEGSTLAERLMALRHLTQQHEALVAAGLNVEAGERIATASAIDKALADTQARLEQRHSPDEQVKSWARGVAQWHTLKAHLAAGSLDPARSLALHDDILRHQQKVLERLLDESGLILDSKAASYHLVHAGLVMLPLAAQQLGDAQAIGMAALSGAGASAMQRAALAYASRAAGVARDGMIDAFDKAFDADPWTKASLADKLSAVNAPIDAAIRMADAGVSEARGTPAGAQAYGTTFDAALEALYDLDSSSLDRLRHILSARATALRQALHLQIGMLASLWLGVALLAGWLVRSLGVPLRAATSMADRIARGDLNGEEQAQGHDKMAHMLMSLKTMRGSLRRIVDESREDAQADLLQVSGAVVTMAERTTQGMRGRGEKITDIIGVIDRIISQAHTLAIDAAVDATRPGEQGRGAAVVSAEVRALVLRSAQAAKEINRRMASHAAEGDDGRCLVTTGQVDHASAGQSS